MCQGKNLLGVSRRRWEDNIKMCREIIGLDCLKWVCLTLVPSNWPAVLNTVMNPGVLLKEGYM